MATFTAFAYNAGAALSGTGLTQVGKIAAATGSLTSGYNWVAGPEEDSGYVIAGENASGNQPTPGGGTSQIQFWRSKLKTDQSFLDLANYMARRYSTPQNFTAATQAASWLSTNGYWNSYPITSTLGTLANPAVSAQAIYDSGQTTSGWYYIKTSNMASAKQIYCNMTDQGGGWMLMTYNPDATAVPQGTPYPNQWLGGTGSFSSKVSIDTRQVWYHNGTAQCTQVMKMASTTASLVPLLANVTIANKVVYTNPNNLKLTATFSTTSAVFTTNTPMSGTWSGIKGHTQMTGNLNVNAPGDWVYATSGAWWTVCGPSNAYPDPQGRSGNALGSGSWTNVGAANIYGMADVSTTGNSNRTDIKTYAVYIK